jgi:hypothetical protein
MKGKKEERKREQRLRRQAVKDGWGLGVKTPLFSLSSASPSASNTPIE